MKTRLLFILFLVISSSPILAQKPSKVPAHRDSMEFCQPNGKKVFIILHGDEHKRFYTTTDGFVIKKNKKEYFCYAKQTCCGTIKPSCRIAKNIGERSKSDNRYLKRMQKKSKFYIQNKN